MEDNCDTVLSVQIIPKKNVYIVIDTKTDDECISSGSLYNHVYANHLKYIDNKRPWPEIIKDSAYIYILDASLINLLPLEEFLSVDKCETITHEMILDSIIVHHEDCFIMFTLSYPPLLYNK